MPGEAALRADVVLIAGPVTAELKADPTYQRLTVAQPGRNVGALGGEACRGVAGNIEKLDFGNRPLFEQFGILIAAAQGKPISLSEGEVRAAKAFIDMGLKPAKYGVIIIAADAIDPLSQFAAMSLCNILSAETRWTLLPLGRPQGQGELIRMCQALTGLPPPISFASIKPVHDPLLYRAPGVARRGEADAVVWISASEKVLPDWVGSMPCAAISAKPDAILADAAQVQIGRPGIDHAALKENEQTGFMTARAATTAAAAPASGGLPSAAQVLKAIAVQLSAKTKGAAA